jgi:ADP-ribose pyrophosphatase
MGRTGMSGRGLLGRFGPNHAADPLVTRWKRAKNGEIVLDAHGQPIMQFVAIQRRDTGEWALPGVW